MRVYGRTPREYITIPDSEIVHRLKVGHNIKLRIEKAGEDTKQCIVECPMYMNKRVVMKPSYTSSWSDEDIIHDLLPKILDRFGLAVKWSVTGNYR